ncbi:MAG TPA: ROK family protein [Chlamydiales bacterium]|nr:ROK family protein [Chlamydiales bacterium]
MASPAAFSPISSTKNSLNLPDVNHSLSDETILCLEIGHTRIKAANLPRTVTLKNLQNVQTLAFPSKPWLDKLNLLFIKFQDNPLSPLFNERPSRISISIFGPLYDNKRMPFNEKMGIPKNIKEVLQRETDYEVLLETDSVSWAIGALEYLKMKLQQPKFPCLAITLGTGVGMALIENEHKIHAIEIWCMDCSFPRMRTLTDLRCPPSVLGKKHLDNLFNGEQFTDEKMVDYRSTYNKQFEAFVEDVCEYVQTLFSQTISTVLIGGGYSRFIEISENAPRSTIVLNPQALQEDGVSPDIIPLLGCQRTCQENRFATSTYPLSPEIARFLSKV